MNPIKHNDLLSPLTRKWPQLQDKITRQHFPIYKIIISLNVFFSIFSPIVVSTDDSVLSQMIPLTEEKVLEMIEAAYPNPLSLPDIGAYVQEHNANSSTRANCCVHVCLCRFSTKQCNVFFLLVPHVPVRRKYTIW